MAEKRMVHRNITRSDKLLHVTNTRGWRAFALYMAHIPYLDKAGRMKANPYGLKGTLWEVHPITADEIAGDLDALAAAGLIYLYRTPKGELVMQYAKFDEEHGGFNKPHPNEPDSEFPAPDADGCRAERFFNDATTFPTTLSTTFQERSAERSDKVAREYEYEKEKELEKTSPPSPPKLDGPPSVPSEADGDDEGPVIPEPPVMRQRSTRRHATSLLAQQHPTAYARLQDLQGIYSWKPVPYGIVAERMLEFARDHGSDRVAAAIDTLLTRAEPVRDPVAWVKKILAQTPKASETTIKTAAEREADLDAIFGLN